MREERGTDMVCDYKHEWMCAHIEKSDAYVKSPWRKLWGNLISLSSDNFLVISWVQFFICHLKNNKDQICGYVLESSGNGPTYANAKLEPLHHCIPCNDISGMETFLPHPVSPAISAKHICMRVNVHNNKNKKWALKRNHIMCFCLPVFMEECACSVCVLHVPICKCMCMFECPFLFLVYMRMDARTCYYIVNKIKQLASEWVSEWVSSEWVSEWVGLRLPCILPSSLFGTFLSSIFAACGWLAAADKLLKCIMFSGVHGWIVMWKPYVWCNHSFVPPLKSYSPIHISKYLTANVHLYNCGHTGAPITQSPSHPRTIFAIHIHSPYPEIHSNFLKRQSTAPDLKI